MTEIKAGIDTGGTFTDFAVMDPDGRWHRLKILSTPDDPSRAIMKGLQELSLFPVKSGTEIVHGTTVGTNAFLERKGARTLLITTAGFEDVLFIGRQARPSLYDFMVEKPAPIIPRENVLGIAERMGPDGKIIMPLDESEIHKALDFCRYMNPESIAVCFLHSYANPEHEIIMTRRLSDALGIPVTRSSSVMPEFREYERLSTTVINAYLNPVVGGYITRLSRSLKGASIFIQQSNGGCLPAASMKDKAVTTLLSGPAGGVQAALRLAKGLGLDDIITFDMGGTSTDVSLCSGRLTYTRDYKIDGYPVGLPIIDIHTVGAGGGSIAWIDRGGLMRVGPQSAGADPGPICYGKGTEVTVTDANLFLGRLRADRFLAGEMKLQPERVKPAMESLGSRIGLDAAETALGIIRLVNSSMVQAIRAVSVERGFDPEGFTLICYGGAAGLHAAEVASELKLDRIIVPERAGVFSARGMADADLVFEGSEALIIRNAGSDTGSTGDRLTTLIKRLEAEFHTASDRNSSLHSEAFVDCRYQGQSFELTVPWNRDWKDNFEALHRRLYGYTFDSRPVEITAIRARVTIKRGNDPQERKVSKLPDILSSDFSPMRLENEETAEVIFESGACDTLLMDRKAIPEMAMLEGPAVIIDDFTTVTVPAGWAAGNVAGNLVLQKMRRQP